MKGNSLRGWQKYAAVIALLCLLIYAGKSGYEKFREQMRLTEIITRVHFVQKSLEVYVREHGEFPLKLSDMDNSSDVGPKFYEPLAGERIEYTRPKKDDPGNTVVLNVIFKSHLIEVDKNLARIEKVDLQKR